MHTIYYRLQYRGHRKPKYVEMDHTREKIILSQSLSGDDYEKQYLFMFIFSNILNL